jgi:hypothetical protein
MHNKIKAIKEQIQQAEEYDPNDWYSLLYHAWSICTCILCIYSDW